MTAALRDLIAILLLIIGPVALITGGVVFLVNQLQEPVAAAVASLSGDDPLDEALKPVPVIALPSPPEHSPPPGASLPPEPSPEIVAPPEIVPQPVAAKKRLGRKDVFAVVKQGRPQLLACARVARERRELKPGRLNLVLDFTVAADGSVASPRLLRPKKHRGTELNLCVVAIVSSWRFPASARPTLLKVPVVLRVE